MTVRQPTHNQGVYQEFLSVTQDVLADLAVIEGRA